MGKFRNELRIFYSSKSVWFVYVFIIIVTAFLNILIGVDPWKMVVAPGIMGFLVLMALFGALNAYVTGLIWRQDLGGGTIINIISSGTTRTEWFLCKVAMIVIECFVISLLSYISGTVYGLLAGADYSNLSDKTVLRSNLSSLLIIFVISLAYSFIATIFFFLIRSYSFALVIAMIATFLGSLAIVAFLLDYAITVSPVIFLYKALGAVDAADPEKVIKTFEQGALIMLIYIAVFGGISFLRCLRKEY